MQSRTGTSSLRPRSPRVGHQAAPRSCTASSTRRCDAVIAIEGGFDPYAISPEVDRPASPAAAVAAAAHDVLVARVPAQAPYVDARYPSAHGCWTKAVTDTLAASFGTDRVALTLDSTVTGTSRTYRRFSAAMHEVFVARIYAGLHFRDSMVDGQALGRRVARHVACNFFQPVDHSEVKAAHPRRECRAHRHSATATDTLGAP